MLLNKTRREVETRLDNPSKAFTIAATPAAFKALISNLYTDKPLAIVRELTSNAYDAHSMVGKQGIPFEVHLPTSINPLLIIRDFGPGLTPEQMLELYTRFFDSTKNQSRTDIGGFGLGSKTPMAYADTFTVISRHKGWKRTYMVYLDETGMPTINLVAEEQVIEPEGLEIQIPVNSRDIYSFVYAARQCLARYNPMPIVTGARVDPVKYLIKTELYGIRNPETNLDIRLAAVCGPTAYPIANLGQLDGLSLEHRSFLNHEQVDVFFDYNDLDIALSREELSYDQATKQLLAQRLTHVALDVQQVIQAKVNEFPTYYEAQQWYSFQLKQALSQGVHIRWQGKTLTSKLTLPDVAGVDVRTITTTRKSGKIKTNRAHWSESTLIPNKGVIVTAPKMTAQLRATLQHNMNNNPIDTPWLLALGTDEQAFKDLSAKLGSAPLVDWEDLVPPPQQDQGDRKRPRIRSTAQSAVLSFQDGKWDETNLHPREDTEETYYYVPLYNRQPQHYDNETLKCLALAAQETGICAPYPRIYGVQKPAWKAAERAGNWVNWYDDLRERVTNYFATPGNVNTLQRRRAHSAYYGTNLFRIFRGLAGNIAVPSTLPKLQEVLDLFQGLDNNAPLSSAETLAAHFNIPFDTNAYKEHIEKTLKVLYHEQPTLEIFIEGLDGFYLGHGYNYRAVTRERLYEITQQYLEKL